MAPVLKEASFEHIQQANAAASSIVPNLPMGMRAVMIAVDPEKSWRAMAYRLALAPAH